MLSELSHTLDEELPGPLSDLTQFLTNAEQVIRRPLELNDDAEQSLRIIKEAQEKYKVLLLAFWLFSLLFLRYGEQLLFAEVGR